MFKQLLQNSFSVLRKPTVKSFQETNVDNWQLAFIYLAIGTALRILINWVTNFLLASYRAQLSFEHTKRFGSDNLTWFYENVQKPFFTLAVGLLSFFFFALLLIFLPYWLGRAFGGSASFGKFSYNSSLFITPLDILGSLLTLLFYGLVMRVLLSLILISILYSLLAFRFYLVYVNLQSTMGLSNRKSALIVFIPIILTIIFFGGILIFFLTGAVS